MRFTEVSDWHDESALLTVPAAAGVFRIDFENGRPYVGKTADLRRRLRRLLVPRDGLSRRLTLRDIARGVHYRATGSPFESSILLYDLARRHLPGDVREHLKLRPLPFVKILMGNRFPRTCVTRRLARSRAIFYGPFQTRAAAKQFEDAFLNLFRVRRCVENLVPSTSHPGCVWGDMGLCLRPCQQACDDDRYAREVARMAHFLATDGASFLREVETARDLASESMEFEEAARQHRRFVKARNTLRLRGGLSRVVGSLCGMVFQRSAEAGSVQATPVYKGSLQAALRLDWDDEPRAALFGAAIREELASRRWREVTVREKEEHLALLQRWHGSSFRKGEFVPFARMSEAPLRRLSNAAMRVAAG